MKKLTTLEEAKEKILGPIGTERRDKYEKKLKRALMFDLWWKQKVILFFKGWK